VTWQVSLLWQLGAVPGPHTPQVARSLGGVLLLLLLRALQACHMLLLLLLGVCCLHLMPEHSLGTVVELLLPHPVQLRLCSQQRLPA
jgi:hypothetical protein